MRRQVWAILLAGCVILLPFAPRVSAALERPEFSEGDFWTYVTNLTEDLGLRFFGNSTLRAGTVREATIQRETVEVLDLLLSGGGTLSATVEGLGSLNGTWSVSGTERWETATWKSVGSYLRLTANGEATGAPAPVPFFFEIVNETTRRILTDTWGWPIAEGAVGTTTASWNATQNATFEIVGLPPLVNETIVTSDLTTRFAFVRAESVTVPAGTFDTYVIREDRPEGGHRLRWMSAATGADVRQEGYNETGDRVATSELVEYGYAAGIPEPAFPWLSILVAVLLAVAVALAVLLLRRRREPEAVWMPPEREPPEEPGASP